MPESKTTYRPHLFWLMATLALSFASLHFPFFWDNILNSRIAQGYMETGFQSLAVPESLDAGHPPFFSLYLAAIWSVFGKSLAVAHLAMLPFLLGIQWLALELGRKLLPKNVAAWSGMIIFLDPALLAQSVQVTPDIAMLFCFLLAVKSILDNRRILLAVSMIGLGMISFRGILAFAAIGLLDLALARLEKRSIWNVRSLWPYLLAGGYALAWLIFHRSAAGWMFTPPDKTYGSHRKLEGFAGILRNAILTGWRLVDHGRIFAWLFAIAGTLRLMKVGRLPDEHKKLILFSLVPAITLAVLFIPFSNPIGHRYFLPTYFFLGLYVLGLAGTKTWGKSTMTIFAVCILGWMSGHAWIYPDKIAKGWDASLAHLPFHKHRASAVDFLQAQGIPRHEVCTDFPAIAAESFIDPGSTDTICFRSLPSSLDSARYVLYSNVCNGFTDEMLTEIQDESKWARLFEEGKWPVRVMILERKDP